MATKSYAYDSSVYSARIGFGGTLSGSGGVTGKFAAFTALHLKSVTRGIQTAATSADASSYLYVVQQGTATTTDTLTAMTSAATAPINDVVDRTLTQGDVFWVAKGTDATAIVGCTIEAKLIPGATVTA